MNTFNACLQKQKVVIQDFSSCKTPESKYKKIIELGKLQKPLDPQFKIPENLVQGCQSIMYLHSFLEDDLMHFEIESDAIISSGLAILLISVYDGETPQTILQCPPNFLQEIGIITSLTPGRANGLASVHLRMKQDALKLLMEKEKQKD